MNGTRVPVDRGTDMPETFIEIAPDVLRWAIQRSRTTTEELRTKFRDLDRWITGETYPTLSQLEKFAKATHTPIGNFFLKAPPEIDLGLTDFRTIGNARLAEPSPELVDTLAICEQRQEWYRDYAIENGFDPVTLVGSLTETMSIQEAAAELRRHVAFDVRDRDEMARTSDAWSAFAAVIEDAGILVMKNGVVGNNTHRPLNPEEFRGFALADEHAPLIFVNGKDTKAATVFTLAHELVHLGLGISSISNLALGDQPCDTSARNTTEQWCSAVAAEFLVPGADLKREYRPAHDLDDEIQRLARRYKVSGFVVSRKMRDEGLICWDAWHAVHQAMSAAWMALPPTKLSRGGGNFYNSMGVRVGRTFAHAILSEARAGNTLYSDALRLLGIGKGVAKKSGWRRHSPVVVRSGRQAV